MLSSPFGYDLWALLLGLASGFLGLGVSLPTLTMIGLDPVSANVTDRIRVSDEPDARLP